MNVADFEEIIIDNSPFAEYLRSLSITDNEGESLDKAFHVESLDDLKTKKCESPSKEIGVSNNFTMESGSLEFYRRLYLLVIESELLHSEESPFLDANIIQNFTHKIPSSPYSITPISKPHKDHNTHTYSKQNNFVYIFQLVGIFVLGLVSQTVFLTMFILLTFSMCILYRKTTTITPTSSPTIQPVNNNHSTNVNSSNSNNASFNLNLENNKVWEVDISKLTFLIDCCKKFDTQVSKAIRMVQEVELISRGYRLSTPLSPIERLEQGAKSRKSQMLREVISDSLNHSIKLLIESSHTLEFTISTDFLGPYKNNIDLPIKVDMNDQTSLYSIKQNLYNYNIIRSRFFSVGLLSFVNLALSLSDEIEMWYAYMSTLLDKLISTTEQEIVEIQKCMQTEVSQTPKRVIIDRNTTHQKLSVWERYSSQTKSVKYSLQETLARIELCDQLVVELKEDLNEENFERIIEKFREVQDDFKNAKKKWEDVYPTFARILDVLQDTCEIDVKKSILLSKLHGNFENEESGRIQEEVLSANKGEVDDVEQTFEAYTGPLEEVLDEIENDENNETEKETQNSPTNINPFQQNDITNTSIPPLPPPMGLPSKNKSRPKTKRATRLKEKNEVKLKKQNLDETNKEGNYNNKDNNNNNSSRINNNNNIYEPKEVIIELKDVLLTRRK